MRKRGMFIAVSLLVLVNVIVLTGIAYNRSGEPAATITLTERELPLSSYSNYSDRANSGLSLRFDWSKGDSFPALISTYERRDNEKTDWFDKEKLEAIGFDCNLPIDDPGADLHYEKMLPRKTFAVLEYEGSAWESWLADSRTYLAETELRVKNGANPEERLKQAREDFDREVRTRTRLFVIDVGNDPKALRNQYSNKGRFLILPAIVRVIYYPSYLRDKGNKAHRLRGEVASILTDTLYVPNQQRMIIEKLQRDSRQKQEMGSDYSRYRIRGPAYEVKLQVGKRGEPWITDIRPLSAEAQKETGGR